MSNDKFKVKKGIKLETNSSASDAAGEIRFDGTDFKIYGASEKTLATTDIVSGTNTGDVTIAAFGSAPDAKGASISGQAITLQPADATHPGLVTTGTQTFAGAKTFSSTISGSIDGNAATATTATNATNIATTTKSDNVNYYLPFVAANSSSNQATNVGPITINPSTSTITATLAGNASTATSATSATSATTATNIAGGAGGSIPYQSAANTTALLANGNSGQYLKSNGTTVAPSWSDVTATVATSLAGGNNTTLLGSIPYQSNTDTTTLLSPNTTTTKKFLRQTGNGTNGAAPAWDTVVAGDITSGQIAVANGGTGAATASAATFFAGPTSGSAAAPSFRALQAPTVQKFTSGTGATYTTATGALFIRVRMVGGGAGGAGSGSADTSSAGGAGGDTFWKTSGDVTLLTAGGAPATAWATSASSTAGTATIGTGTYGTALSGGRGMGSSAEQSYASGGQGGSSFFGGAGGGGGFSAGGGAASANTGSGGGGGGNPNTANSYTGQGGGSGGYIDCYIASPAATYHYTVGAAGTAGSAGTGGAAGGAGAAGYIEVTEYYQ